MGNRLFILVNTSTSNPVRLPIHKAYRPRLSIDVRVESFDAYGQITLVMKENKENQVNRQCLLLNQMHILSVELEFQNGLAVGSAFFFEPKLTMSQMFY